MPRFRAKTDVIVEAMQWTEETSKALYRWAGARGQHHLPDGWGLRSATVKTEPFEAYWLLMLPTLDGAVEAVEGDWIVRGVIGEYSVLKPDAFKAIYELADETGTGVEFETGYADLGAIPVMKSDAREREFHQPTKPKRSK